MGKIIIVVNNNCIYILNILVTILLNLKIILNLFYKLFRSKIYFSTNNSFKTYKTVIYIALFQLPTTVTTVQYYRTV